jgi:hypothetical protein
MKNKLSYTLGVITLAMLVFIASPAKAQTTANGPYYANPSWDQRLQCDTPATCPRFIVLSNWNSDAVLDRETGLVWEKSPRTSTFTWLFAESLCDNLSKGNRKGWRLPTIQELASLIDPSVPAPGPALPAGHPFINVQSSFYWSATTRATAIDAVGTTAGSALAWEVYFGDGTVTSDGKANDAFMWCVRGGHGVDPQ